jgi:phosphoglycolate phosphatase-like HAD superfamily hydrolase
MIGDHERDIEAARRAGCRGVLLGAKTEAVGSRQVNGNPILIARDLLEAAYCIIEVTEPS